MRAADVPGFPVTFAAALGSALIASGGGVDLESPTMTLVACAAILTTGLPHGTFDLALIRRRPAPGATGRVVTLITYLAAAAAMFALWRAEPLAGLLVFLAISVAHFAEDWPATGRLAGAAIAASVLAAPALFHRDEIGAIFRALTGDTRAMGIVTAMRVAAPVAVCGAVLGVLSLVRAGRGSDAAGAVLAILATLTLPPAIGFALYFCLFHSPRNFRAALATLGWGPRRWATVVVPLTIAASAIVGALFAVQAGAEPSSRLLSATFVGLSILTVPHMAVPAIVRWLDARTGVPIRARPVRSR